IRYNVKYTIVVRNNLSVSELRCYISLQFPGCTLFEERIACKQKQEEKNEKSEQDMSKIVKLSHVTRAMQILNREFKRVVLIMLSGLKCFAYPIYCRSVDAWITAF